MRLDKTAAAADGLRVRGLSAGYGAADVLGALDLEAPTGSVHGIVGRNGVGKTTLLEVIAGYHAPRRGAVEWNGATCTHRDVAYLPTRLAFYPRITGEEYVAVFQRGNASFDAARWARALDVPLRDYVETYSSGTARKLALLGVLCADRPLLLLDEPFTGLDAVSTIIVSHTLGALAKRGRRTVVVTSHLVDILAVTCDWIHLLDAGRIAASYDRARFGVMRRELLDYDARERLALADALVV